MDDTITIRRLLIVAGESCITESLDEAAAAFGLLLRVVPGAGRLASILQEFGPDAVILDPALVPPEAAAGAEVIGAIRASGANLLLLGRPDEPGFAAVRELAREHDIKIGGALARPVMPESLETALRVMVGKLAISPADISAAVMRGEIGAWYQLQLLRAPSGWHAAGAEALARWQHPDHGLIMPAAFVPIAEAEGQIAAITDCVLQTTVQQLAVWHRMGMSFRVGVNLAPSLVKDPDFPERLSRLVLEYDVPPRSLLLEIPEPSLATVPADFLGMLARLRVHGFGIALEHFGAGVSSLAELYRTPFSELKIHRRLVGALEEDEDARQLVRGIIALARELGLETAAEAVETREAMDFLHEAGCNRIQGFIVSRPLPATAFQVVAAQWL